MAWFAEVMQEIKKYIRAARVLSLIALGLTLALLTGCTPKNPFREVDETKALNDARAEINRMTGGMATGTDVLFTLNSNAFTSLRAIEPTHENKRELQDLYDSTYPNFAAALSLYQKKHGGGK